MRAWLPERQVYGPEPAGERDTEGLNRVFADAFTDRSRRDGLVGVRVPHLNPQVWRYALLDAGPGAMLWRDEAGHVVAFNIAHRSGAEGWMGPLAVRPDRQGAGVGKTIVRTALDWLLEQDVATLGLETMPRTVENIGFYARLGTRAPSMPRSRRPKPPRPAPASGGWPCDARPASTTRSAGSWPAAIASAGPTSG